MEFNVRKTLLHNCKTECLLVPVFEGGAPLGLSKLSKGFRDEISQLIKGGELAPKKSKTLLYYPKNRDQVERALLVSLGKEDDYKADVLRNAVAHAIKVLAAVPVKKLSFQLDKKLWCDGDFSRTAAICVEAGLLCSYRFEGYKKEADEKPELAQFLFYPPSVKTKVDATALRFAEVSALGACVARDLGNRPANKLTPGLLVERARDLTKEAGVKLTVLDQKKMQALGMNSLLSVSKGSVEPPYLLIMEHNPKGRKKLPKIALVGKGVTFDSGGISIKPSSGMEDMKYDMCGAAAVIGTLWAAAKLGLPVHVYGVVATVENMPSGTATHPGDVVTAMNGKSVEIINTDAEGRLILADALSYTEKKLKPEAMIDLATLTGACVVALGNVAAGVMSKDDALFEAISEASDFTGEKIWRLPLFSEYKKQLSSTVADVKNAGGRWGGACTAGFFLSSFVDKVPWAHIDIAPTAWNLEGKEYYDKAATGFGVRLLLEYLRRKG